MQNRRQAIIWTNADQFWHIMIPHQDGCRWPGTFLPHYVMFTVNMSASLKGLAHHAVVPLECLNVTFMSASFMGSTHRALVPMECLKITYMSASLMGFTPHAVVPQWLLSSLHHWLGPIPSTSHLTQYRLFKHPAIWVACHYVLPAWLHSRAIGFFDRIPIENTWWPWLM